MLKISAKNVFFHLHPRFCHWDENMNKVIEPVSYIICALIDYDGFLDYDYYWVNIDGIIIQMYCGGKDRNRYFLVSKDTFEEV